jgi:molybdate transport system substrate-binding protein
MRSFRCLLTLLVFAMAGCGEKSSPGTTTTATPSRVSITVAAASDLKFAFEEIVSEFKKSHPDIGVETTYGSSGNFFAQLSNKAPIDIFLSADLSYPRKLIEQGLADQESEFPYAIGRICVWVRKESPLDLDQHGIIALNDPAVQKLAIANPKHAPYGRAAEAALKHFRIYESVQDRLVMGENIAQTAQFIESGAADAGMIALSLALAPTLREQGRHWIVPIESYPKLEQGGVILTWAKNRDACEQLRAFIISDAGKAILLRYGFEQPGE